MKRGVLIGGFTESDVLLDPVAEQLTGREGVFEDVDVFTFRAALGGQAMLAALASKNVPVVTHSAGAMMMESQEFKPSMMFAFNGPESASIPALMGRTARKIGHHVRGIVEGDESLRRAQVLSENTLEIVNPVRGYENLRHLGAISRFETFSSMTEMRERLGSAVLAHVETLDDELFPPFNHTFLRRTIASENSIHLAQNSGGHDEVLVRPQIVTATIKDILGN